MVAMTVSMLTTPSLFGRFGCRRTHTGTMGLLLAGGLPGGVANDHARVLVARVAKGMAAGVVRPIPAIIVMRAFEPHECGCAMGVFGTASVLAPALEPSIGGGWLSQQDPSRGSTSRRPWDPASAAAGRPVWLALDPFSGAAFLPGVVVDVVAFCTGRRAHWGQRPQRQRAAGPAKPAAGECRPTGPAQLPGAVAPWSDASSDIVDGGSLCGDSVVCAAPAPTWRQAVR